MEGWTLLMVESWMGSQCPAGRERKKMAKPGEIQAFLPNHLLDTSYFGQLDIGVHSPVRGGSVGKDEAFLFVKTQSLRRRAQNLCGHAYRVDRLVGEM